MAVPDYHELQKAAHRVNQRFTDRDSTRVLLALADLVWGSGLSARSRREVLGGIRKRRDMGRALGCDVESPERPNRRGAGRTTRPHVQLTQAA
jgi:hypothetical protein